MKDKSSTGTVSIKDTTKNPKKSTWRKEVKAGSTTTCVNVKELDNGGFLVSLEKYGYNNKNEYYNEPSKDFYSKTNPLDDSDKETDEYCELQDLFMSPVEKLMNE